MDGFGDCVMTRAQGTQRKGANAMDPSILFIQRNTTCVRHVTNFEELVDTVKSRGFKQLTVVDFSLLTREKQLETVSKADVMIAPHGAGLGWMSVMAKGGVVMELNNKNPPNYARWAEWDTNVHYVRVEAEQDGTIDSCTSSRERRKIISDSESGNENPMRVPLQSFVAGFDQALAALRR